MQEREVGAPPYHLRDEVVPIVWSEQSEFPPEHQAVFKVLSALKNFIAVRRRRGGLGRVIRDLRSQVLANVPRRLVLVNAGDVRPGALRHWYGRGRVYRIGHDASKLQYGRPSVALAVLVLLEYARPSNARRVPRGKEEQHVLGLLPLESGGVILSQSVRQDGRDDVGALAPPVACG